jgi:hypothetical protein
LGGGDTCLGGEKVTHSLYFKVVFGSWDKAKLFRSSFYDYGSDFIDLYLLVKSGNSFHQRGDSQPFLYFPVKDERDDDGTYHLSIETGSHVGVKDTLYARHWYDFTRAFADYFRDDLEELAEETYYQEEGTDEKLSAAEMLTKIMRGAD